jgi:ribonuclease HI
MAEEGNNLQLMWAAAHTEIKGNEEADEAAKKSLKQEVETTHKVVWVGLAGIRE